MNELLSYPIAGNNTIFTIKKLLDKKNSFDEIKIDSIKTAQSEIINLNSDIQTNNSNFSDESLIPKKYVDDKINNLLYIGAPNIPIFPIVDDNINELSDSAKTDRLETIDVISWQDLPNGIPVIIKFGLLNITCVSSEFNNSLPNGVPNAVPNGVVFNKFNTCDINYTYFDNIPIPRTITKMHYYKIAISGECNVLCSLLNDESSNYTVGAELSTNISNNNLASITKSNNGFATITKLGDIKIQEYIEYIYNNNIITFTNKSVIVVSHRIMLNIIKDTIKAKFDTNIGYTLKLTHDDAIITMENKDDLITLQLENGVISKNAFKSKSHITNILYGKNKYVLFINSKYTIPDDMLNIENMFNYIIIKV